ncbi:hypothetical protein J8L69_10220 [Photorhabdus aegyptia]|nr:hypothetical protein [Photorhabdus aegyptia]
MPATTAWLNILPEWPKTSPLSPISLAAFRINLITNITQQCGLQIIRKTAAVSVN